MRVKALPTSLSLPWGLNTGAVGMPPYLPLPSKLHTRVLAATTARPDEDAKAWYAERIHPMRDALTEMTEHRTPLLVDGDRRASLTSSAAATKAVVPVSRVG